MSYYFEKFLLLWNDLRQNIDSSYQDLRYNPDFCDVTLVYEEDQHIEAHTMFFTASACFPGMYFKGTQIPSHDLQEFIMILGANGESFRA
jgi:hypothetical protein